MLLSSTTCKIPEPRIASVIAVLILSPDPSKSGSFARGGSNTYAAVAPARAFAIAATSSASAVATSAPNCPSGANLCASRATARTFSPRSSSVFATTDPVFPVAPITTYMSSLPKSLSLLSSTSLCLCDSVANLSSPKASAPSHLSSSQTQSPPDNPHPRVESHPFRDRSSTPFQSAPPSLSFHPPRSPDPNVANSRSPLRRRCESTPTTRHSPYSPAHSAAASPQLRPTRPASIPSRDTGKPRSRNPDDPAQSPPGLSIHRSPPNRSKPIQICRARHSPASKSARAIPETSLASVPSWICWLGYGERDKFGL